MNKKRLRTELIIIGAIILGIVLWRFLPWFFAQPLPTSGQPYAEYELLYNEVVEYDFNKGPSSYLENKIDRILSGNNSPIQLYYNLKAKTEYYYRLGDYEKALEAAKEASNYAHIPSESEYIEDMIKKLEETP